jgi:ABC-type transport system involved in cytochrome bd biosynthesis fused ATPase/permease subunit
VKWAAIVVGLVALQITLGLLGHSLPFLALLHGLNALLLASAAFYAQLRAGRAQEPPRVPVMERPAARV